MCTRLEERLGHQKISRHRSTAAKIYFTWDSILQAGLTKDKINKAALA